MELFATDELDGGEADEEEGAGPGVGDGVLLAAGFVPEAAEEGDAAEAGSGEADEGDQKEIRQPAEGKWRLL